MAKNCEVTNGIRPFVCFRESSAAGFFWTDVTTLSLRALLKPQYKR